MKKIGILLMFLVQITVLFAKQTKEINKEGPTGIIGLQRPKQDIPKNNNGSSNSGVNNANSASDGAETISNWMPASTCFPEIYYQVKTRGPSHPRNYKHDGTYSVWVKFKNVSGKAVKFWAKIAVPNSTRGEFELNYQLAPGTIDQNAFGETHATSPPRSVQVNVFKATYNISTTNYIECNNGIKNNGSNNIDPKANSNNSIIDMTIVNVKPEYPGGISEAYKFIGSKIKYPTLAVENDIKGTVIASFTVELDGSISEIQIVKSLGYGCDEEVIRVLQAMPKWKPGMQNGKPVRVRFSLPVKFS